MHDEPHVVSEQDLRIEAATSAKADGSVCLRVERIGERTIEQEFWRERAESGTPVTESALTGDLRVAADPYYATSNSNSGDGWFGLAIVGLYAVVVVVGGVASACILVGKAVVALVIVRMPFDDQRATIHRTEAVRRLSASAVIESATTSERIDLGPQPENGWILTPEILRRLGGKGADVVVRDGELSATLSLPEPR